MKQENKEMKTTKNETALPTKEQKIETVKSSLKTNIMFEDVYADDDTVQYFGKNVKKVSNKVSNKVSKRKKYKEKNIYADDDTVQYFGKF